MEVLGIGYLERMMNADFGNVDHFYSKYYALVLRTGLIGVAQDQTHRAIERRWSKNSTFELVLEVGAGAGDHWKFVKHQYLKYYETDIRFSDDSYTSGKIPSYRNSIKNLVRESADVMSLDYKDGTFDRVIVTCLLLHLEKPEIALSEIRRVTKMGGVISLLVPCKPGLLLRISRGLLTSWKARKVGFEGYKLFNARDHINYLSGIDKLIKFVFRKDKIAISRLPFRWPSWNFNLYYIYTIYRGDDA